MIDAPLDYNLLLGRSWTYAMCEIMSNILRVVVLQHEGKLVTIDQLSFTQKGHMETNDSTMPLVDQVKPANESLGIGMYSSQMGNFNIPSPVNYLGSTFIGKSVETVVDKIDPLVPTSRNELEVPSSAVDVTCQDIVDTSADPIMTLSLVSGELDEVYPPTWIENSSHSYDCLDMVFLPDKDILETMSG